MVNQNQETTTEVINGIYDSKGRVKILYERHYFYKYTGGKYKDRDISYSRSYHRSKDINPATGKLYPREDVYGRSYERFNKAKALDEEAAYKSISYGAFQTMGANYKSAGYSSAVEFGNDMFAGDEDKMLVAFANFIKSNPKLLKALKEHDWKMFAKIYNGPNYKKNNYDTTMKTNYERFKNNPCKWYDNMLDEVVVIGHKSSK